jgi:hypothetical protein
MNVPEEPDAYHSLDVELGSSGEYQPVELADGLAVLDAGLDQALETPTLPPGTAIDVPDQDQDEPPALEMEAMAPDEDVPGMAPYLEGSELDEEAADEDATIDVRSPNLRHDIVLDDVFDDLPPPGTRPGIVTIQPRPFHDVHDVLDLEHAGARPLVVDDEAGRTARTEPPRVRPASASAEMDAIGIDDLSADHDLSRDPRDHEEDEATRAYDRRMGRPARGPVRPLIEKTRSTFSTYDPEDLPTARRHPLRPNDYAESDLTSDYEDASKTRERNPFGEEDVTGSQPRVRQNEASSGPHRDSSVIIDQRFVGDATGAPAGSRSDADRTSDFHRSREPGHEARDERVHKRVTELLRQAEDFAAKGDYLKAITAVETAAKDDEEGAVAPVLLHRHRDLLYRIYEGHIGDMRAVPLVAVPLHEIASKSLDHRTGFLLSRIDGMLTFEDILDVAGMPRMEAYQILSSLLRKGVIEVR